MVFVRRGVRGRRTKRNSAWSAIRQVRTTIAPGATSTITVCDAAAQLAVGLSPTLVRLRGHIVVDPDITPASITAQFWTVFAMIYQGPAGLTADSTGLSNEGVLWADIISAQSAHWAIVAGADSEMLGGYAINHDVRTIDSKAKRRLEQPGDQVTLVIQNSSTSTSDIQYSCYVRCLVMT